MRRLTEGSAYSKKALIKGFTVSFDGQKVIRSYDSSILKNMDIFFVFLHFPVFTSIFYFTLPPAQINLAFKPRTFDMKTKAGQTAGGNIGLSECRES